MAGEATKAMGDDVQIWLLIASVVIRDVWFRTTIVTANRRAFGSEQAARDSVDAFVASVKEEHGRAFVSVSVQVLDFEVDARSLLCRG